MESAEKVAGQNNNRVFVFDLWRDLDQAELKKPQSVCCLYAEHSVVISCSRTKSRHSSFDTLTWWDYITDARGNAV